MLTRIVIALSVVFLAGAVFAATADATPAPSERVPDPITVTFTVFREESCPTGVLKTIERPSPKPGDDARFVTVIEGSIAPATPVFDKPRWTCTITATFSIDEGCLCAAPSAIYKPAAI